MMLSDVLAERENQIKIKEELNRLEQIRERKYHEMMRHNHERILEREEHERIRNRERKLAVAKIQEEQLRESVSRKRSEVECERREGFAQRMAYQKQVEDDELATRAEKDRGIKALNDSRQAQKYLIQLKERTRILEAAQDSKIKEYAQRQEAIETKRRDRLKLLFDEKLRIRQKMIDTQAARLAAIRDSADKRTEEQCREVTTKMEKLEVEQREYQLQMIQNMESERKKAIDRKQRERNQQKETEKVAVGYMNAVLKKLDEVERESEVLKTLHAQEIRNELMKQIDEKREQHSKQSEVEHSIPVQARELEDGRLQRFTHYAESVINEYAEQGRNIVPMVNVLRKEHRKDITST